MSDLSELHKAHRDSAEKYIYFLLAAAGAAIAFAATQTQSATLTWIKLPLGLAVLCWGMSFSAGVAKSARQPTFSREITKCFA
jgi:hypothetical protein